MLRVFNVKVKNLAFITSKKYRGYMVFYEELNYISTVHVIEIYESWQYTCLLVQCLHRFIFSDWASKSESVKNCSGLYN